MLISFPEILMNTTIKFNSTLKSWEKIWIIVNGFIHQWKMKEMFWIITDFKPRKNIRGLSRENWKLQNFHTLIYEKNYFPLSKIILLFYLSVKCVHITLWLIKNVYTKNKILFVIFFLQTKQFQIYIILWVSECVLKFDNTYYIKMPFVFNLAATWFVPSLNQWLQRAIMTLQIKSTFRQCILSHLCYLDTNRAAFSRPGHARHVPRTQKIGREKKRKN